MRLCKQYQIKKFKDDSNNNSSNDNNISKCQQKYCSNYRSYALCSHLSKSHNVSHNIWLPPKNMGPGVLQSMGLQSVGHDWATVQKQRI